MYEVVEIRKLEYAPQSQRRLFLSTNFTIKTVPDIVDTVAQAALDRTNARGALHAFRAPKL